MENKSLHIALFIIYYMLYNQKQMDILLTDKWIRKLPFTIYISYIAWFVIIFHHYSLFFNNRWTWQQYPRGSCEWNIAEFHRTGRSTMQRVSQRRPNAFWKFLHLNIKHPLRCCCFGFFFEAPLILGWCIIIYFSTFIFTILKSS